MVAVISYRYVRKRSHRINITVRQVGAGRIERSQPLQGEMIPVEYGFEPNNTKNHIRNYAGITINVRQNITVCPLFRSEAVDIGSASLHTRTMAPNANDHRGESWVVVRSSGLISARLP
jgi:hypothetical protein